MFRRLLMFLLLALPLTAPFWAQNEAEIYRDVSPSVVSIAVEISGADTAGGAGFVIDDDGHILTNAHVVEEARALTVIFHDGYEASAHIIGMDTRVDLAVIKVDVARRRRKPVAFGDSDALVVGEAVVAIGSPHGLDATLTRGIISGLNRRLEFDDGTVMEDAIQTDAALAPGNSGGPLLNQAGEVIGVNTAGYRGTALGFAIPSNLARNVIDRLIANLLPIPVASPVPLETLTPTDTPIPTDTPRPTATVGPTVAPEDAMQATFAAWQAATEAMLAATDIAEISLATEAALATQYRQNWDATRTQEAAVKATFHAWQTGTPVPELQVQRQDWGELTINEDQGIWLNSIGCWIGHFSLRGDDYDFVVVRLEGIKGRFTVTHLSSNEILHTFKRGYASSPRYYFRRKKTRSETERYAITIKVGEESEIANFDLRNDRRRHYIVYSCEEDPFAPTKAPPPTMTPTPTPLLRTHTVQAGDTLFGIAAEYGVSVVELAQLNGIEDYNLLRISQVLRIPHEG